MPSLDAVEDEANPTHTKFIDLNSNMRRIDLFSKLLAPVFISAVDGFSATIAIWTVLGVNALSVLLEYFAIAQVCLKISLHCRDLISVGVQHCTCSSSIREFPGDCRNSIE